MFSELKNFKYTIMLGLLVLVFLYILTAVGKANHDCESRGGAYVKTMTGYECIGDRNP